MTLPQSPYIPCNEPCLPSKSSGIRRLNLPHDSMSNRLYAMPTTEARPSLTQEPILRPIQSPYPFLPLLLTDSLLSLHPGSSHWTGFNAAPASLLALARMAGRAAALQALHPAAPALQTALLSQPAFDKDSNHNPCRGLHVLGTVEQTKIKPARHRPPQILCGLVSAECFSNHECFSNQDRIRALSPFKLGPGGRPRLRPIAKRGVSSRPSRQWPRPVLAARRAGKHVRAAEAGRTGAIVARLVRLTPRRMRTLRLRFPACRLSVEAC